METFYVATQEDLTGPYSQPGNLETGEPEVIINPAETNEEKADVGPVWDREPICVEEAAGGDLSAAAPASELTNADVPAGLVDQQFAKLAKLRDDARAAVSAFAHTDKKIRVAQGRLLRTLQAYYASPHDGTFIRRAMEACGCSSAGVYRRMVLADKEDAGSNLYQIGQIDKESATEEVVISQEFQNAMSQEEKDAAAAEETRRQQEEAARIEKLKAEEEERKNALPKTYRHWLHLDEPEETAWKSLGGMAASAAMKRALLAAAPETKSIPEPGIVEIAEDENADENVSA